MPDTSTSNAATPNDADLPPTFVISLPDSDRRPVMKARMDAAGLPFQWWDAIDGRTREPSSFEKYNPTRAILRFGRGLISGELALFQTTLDLYQHCIEQQIPHIVIFEDDAIPDERCKLAIREIAMKPWEGITQLYAEIVSTADGANRASHLTRLIAVLLTGDRSLFYRSFVRTAWHGSCFKVIETTHGGNYTVAYMIDLASMKRIIERTPVIWCPIDEWLRRTYAHRVRMQTVLPRCVEHDLVGMPSVLEQGRQQDYKDFDSTAPRWVKWAGRVTRHLEPARIRKYRFANIKNYT